jgi:hypothetical protein
MADPAYIVNGVLTDGEAWVGIATTTVVGAATATVTFTSPDDGSSTDWSQFMDLVLISYGRNGDGSASVMKMALNNDTGANYPLQQLYSTGDAVTAASTTAGTYLDFLWYPPSATAANVFASSITTLFDINSGKYKSAIVQIANDMDGSGYVSMAATTWKNQSPITEIDLTDYSGDNIAAGSMFSLFGVLPRMVTA